MFHENNFRGSAHDMHSYNIKAKKIKIHELIFRGVRQIGENYAPQKFDVIQYTNSCLTDDTFSLFLGEAAILQPLHRVHTCSCTN